MKSHHKKNTTPKTPEIKESVQEGMISDPEMTVDFNDGGQATGVKMILTQNVQYYLSILAFASIVVIAVFLLFIFIANN